MSFLVRREGEVWRQPASSSYGNEAELQDLLAKAPSLIPVDEEVRLVREFWVPDVGSIDLVGITAEGNVVVVECKLRANPQIRREVVGQSLAYAGGLWQMPFEDFVAEFEYKSGEVLDDTLRGLGAEDPSSVRSTIAESLRSGDFRVVIAVDEITEELKTIVEYLNGHTSGMEVVALELGYSRDGDVEILVPTIYGLESATAKRTDSAPSKKWNMASIRDAVDRNCTEQSRAFCHRLLEHGEIHGTRFNFGSGLRPGMSCYFLVGGKPTSLWALYPYEDAQVATPSIGAVAGQSQQLAHQYLSKLRASPAISSFLSDVSETDLNKFPSVRIDELDDAAIQIWLDAIDSIRDESP